MFIGPKFHWIRYLPPCNNLMYKRSPLQFRLYLCIISFMLQHCLNLWSSLGKMMFQFSCVPLQTRNRPSDKVISYRIWKTITIRYHCVKERYFSVVLWYEREQNKYKRAGNVNMLYIYVNSPSPYPQPFKYRLLNWLVLNSQWLDCPNAGSVNISGRGSPFNIFLSPKRWRSTPWPSVAHAAYWACRRAASVNNIRRRLLSLKKNKWYGFRCEIPKIFLNKKNVLAVQDQASLLPKLYSHCSHYE